MMPAPRPLEDRFKEKVETAGHNGCHLWMATTSHGYGQIRLKGKYKKAHHAAWFLEYGVWPKYLLHSCDVRNCVNVAHLREGTHKENMADMTAKGRHAHGESNGQSKLKAHQVHEIRILLASGVPQREIARKFGVVQPCIGHISTGRAWRHVT